MGGVEPTPKWMATNDGKPDENGCPHFWKPMKPRDPGSPKLRMVMDT